MSGSFALGFAVLLASCLFACNNSSSPTPTQQLTQTTGTISIYPGAATVPLGGTVNFLANLAAQPSATFTWSIASGSGNGSINSSTGLYTAPTSSIPNPSTVTVTAKSGSSTGTATITITSAQPVTVSPSALFVQAGATETFSATNSSGPVTVTQWQVNTLALGNDTVGHITSSGVYTAPLTPPPGGAVTITALSANGSGTAVATVVFSANSFNGPYAFSYTGNSSAGFLQVAGSFTANAATGAISGGVEDSNTGSKNADKQASFTGTFTVGPDGNAVATINDGLGPSSGASIWRFVLAANDSPSAAGLPVQKASLIRFDTAATGSGALYQQTASDLNAPMPLPAYVFGISGINSSGATFEAAGEFSQAAGFFSLGTWDVNYSGIAAPLNDSTLSGSFHSDNDNTGRGILTLSDTNTTLTLTSFTFAFYVIDETHVKLIEIDGNNFASGDIFSAPNTNGSFNAGAFAAGNYAFALGGVSAGTSVPYTLGGVLTSNGGGTTTTSTSGNISGGVIDRNGGVGTITTDASLSSQSYTINATTGRITFTLTTSKGGSIGNPTFAAYPTSSNSLEIIETDTAGPVTSGQAFLQSATASLQGSFAIGIGGIPNVKGDPVKQNAAGQFIVSNGAVTYGSLSINSGSVQAGQPITQAVLFSTDTNGRGSGTLETSPANFQFAYYTIDANTSLLTETDGQRVVIGTVAKQF